MQGLVCTTAQEVSVDSIPFGSGMVTNEGTALTIHVAVIERSYARRLRPVFGF
jgi:hypothetical protein